MDFISVIVLCLFSFAVGSLVGGIKSERSYLNMLKDQKKIDDEIIKRLAEYIEKHIKKDTEEKNK